MTDTAKILPLSKAVKLAASGAVVLPADRGIYPQEGGLGTTEVTATVVTVRAATEEPQMLVITNG